MTPRKQNPNVLQSLVTVTACTVPPTSLTTQFQFSRQQIDDQVQESLARPPLPRKHQQNLLTGDTTTTQARPIRQRLVRCAPPQTQALRTPQEQVRCAPPQALALRPLLQSMQDGAKYLTTGTRAAVEPHCVRRQPTACVLASLDRHAKGTRRAQVAVHVHATPSLTHNSPQGGSGELLAAEILRSLLARCTRLLELPLPWQKPTDT